MLETSVNTSDGRNRAALTLVLGRTLLMFCLLRGSKVLQRIPNKINDAGEGETERHRVTTRGNSVGMSTALLLIQLLLVLIPIPSAQTPSLCTYPFRNSLPPFPTHLPLLTPLHNYPLLAPSMPPSLSSQSLTSNKTHPSRHCCPMTTETTTTPVTSA